MIEKFMKRREVSDLTRLSRSAIYAGMRNGTFPHTVKVGKSAVVWRALEIEAWQAARIAESRDGTAT